ncbi:MAG: hypothetical protein AB8B91_13355 [Rubripirellula sp.]
MNSTPNPQPKDIRRTVVLILAITLIVVYGVIVFGKGQGGANKFFAEAAGRIGLVMGALWLAWPSLRKPARWLPPGVAVMGVVVLAALAAQPRLIVVAIPAMGTLLAIATLVRAMKRH